jgi:enoyl-CoA hydratase/3-hydroxyacyl-CoA dehydrogenase
MKVDDVKKIAVMGAGVMGHGIAQVALLAGYKVALRDIEQRFVDKGVQGIKESLQKFYVNKNKITPEQMDKMLTEQLQPVVDIEKAVYDADVVIEVVPEDIGIKHSVFKELDKYAPKHAILASNTSMMSITKIAEVTNRPDKVVGMHFFNPPVIMKLVEIVKGEKTSEETMEVAFNLAKKLGKVPVRVEKDSTGFIVNRITAPNMALQLAILDRKLAQPEEIDAMMKQKAMMPMGPYELLDYVGLDVAYDTQQYCAQTLSPDYKPPQFLEQMVGPREDLR